MHVSGLDIKGLRATPTHFWLAASPSRSRHTAYAGL